MQSASYVRLILLVCILFYSGLPLAWDTCLTAYCLLIRRDLRWADSVHCDMPTARDLSSLVPTLKHSQPVTLYFAWLTLHFLFLSFHKIV